MQFAFWVIDFAIVKEREVEVCQDFHQMVSVIICAHNEAEQLTLNLPHILSQTHPNFEVVVVNHGSQDNSAEILQKLAHGQARLKTVFVPYEKPGKRPALREGIANSSGDIYLFTDADCRPTSSNWIKAMVTPLEKEASIALGAAPFYPEAGLVNAFSRWENFVTLQLFAARALRQAPFMAVGRNVAYSKQILEIESIPYQNHHLIGGDDDLLINVLGKTHQSAVVLDAQAQMLSHPPETWISLLRQKRRHVSTSREYAFGDKLFLFLFATSTWTLHLSLFGLIFLGHLKLSFGLYIIRIIYLTLRVRQTTGGNNVAFHFGLWLPLVDLLYLIYYPLITLFMLQKPPTKWK